MSNLKNTVYILTLFTATLPQKTLEMNVKRTWLPGPHIALRFIWLSMLFKVYWMRNPKLPLWEKRGWKHSERNDQESERTSLSFCLERKKCWLQSAQISIYKPAFLWKRNICQEWGWIFFFFFPWSNTPSRYSVTVGCWLVHVCMCARVTWDEVKRRVGI